MVLQEFGKVLQATVRRGDVACRYGGEEFAVLMLDCPLAGAERRAEEIRLAIEHITIDYRGTTICGTTTSIGAAVVMATTASPEQLVAQADDALYRAKENGRNRVALHIAANAKPTATSGEV